MSQANLCTLPDQITAALAGAYADAGELARIAGVLTRGLSMAIALASYGDSAAATSRVDHAQMVLRRETNSAIKKLAEIADRMARQ